MATEQELERLVVRLMGDGSSYTKMMDEAEKASNKMADSIESKTVRLRSFRQALQGHAGQFLSTITGLAGGLGLLNTVTRGVQLAADAEKMESAFKVMLHSGERAKQLMGELQQFAAETPLEMADLSQFAKMLLQAQVPADKMVDTLRMLGDVSMGDRNKMQGMAYAFQQVKTATRLTGNELWQFMNAGFNPLKELSRTSGKSIEQLRGEMEKGLITFEMVEQAFKTASGPTGDFFNGMKEASTTLSGLFSTMQDDLAGFQRTIGKEIITLFRLKEVVAGVSSAAQTLTGWFKSLPEWVKTTTFVVGGLLLAVGVLGIVGPAVLAAFSMAWGAVTAAASTLLPILLSLATSPVGIALIALGVVLKVLIDRAGGLEAVWNSLVAKLQEFWEWTRPLRDAAAAVWDAIVRKGAEAWEWIKGIVSSVADWFYQRWSAAVAVLGAVFSKLGLTFDSVRGFLIDMMIMAEFVFNNMQQSWDTLWAGLKYAAVVALNSMLKLLVFVFGGEGWRLATKVFEDNWQTLWTNLTTTAAHAMTNLVQAGAKFYGLLMDVLQGKPADWGGFFSGVVDGFKQVALEGTEAMRQIKLPTAEELEKMIRGVQLPGFDQVEAQLKKEWEGLQDRFVGDFATFRAQRLKELFASPAQEDPAKKGEDDGQQYGKGLSKGISGTAAVLFNSAEALSRRLEYAERMREGRNNMKGANTPPGSVVGEKAMPTAAAVAKQTDLLKKIADNTGQTAKKETMPVEPANF